MSGKQVLIIGGTGTLGQALVDELLTDASVGSIRIFARNEHKTFEMRQKYGEPVQKMRYFLGDIRDKSRLNMAMQGVDIVINCAAIKHVLLADENPFETIQTNVVGVQNALECAVENNVEVFVQISTDKAVNPVNLYGCSKATAEYLVLDAANWQGNNRTRFIVCRSGNILGSSGSVIEIWKKQAEQGIPLTVTDPRATRYGATKEKIAQAILGIITTSSLQGLVVLMMHEYSILELLAPFASCEVVEVGLKPFEKLHEEMYREGEKYTLWGVD